MNEHLCPDCGEEMELIRIPGCIPYWRCKNYPDCEGAVSTSPRVRLEEEGTEE